MEQLRQLAEKTLLIVLRFFFGEHHCGAAKNCRHPQLLYPTCRTDPPNSSASNYILKKTGALTENGAHTLL